MSLARRHDYLRAMGIDVWIPRAASPAAEKPRLTPALATETGSMHPSKGAVHAAGLSRRIIIGPGSGNTLLLCGSSTEAATELAADIARSLEGEPVWSWPAQDESGPGITLAQSIEERLFTRVLVFGCGLSGYAENASSQVIGSARLICTDPIPTLVESGAARRRLWLELSALRWCDSKA